ncbi:CBF1 interacting corepressor protein [Dioscorea alata]|uniref:CBF1 interacting corepressor protein n=1 Tax=Dioscorea alata TaxID=55571 RepID=A0ACB7V650_DIOAL|nr:CBF1 interacting corepressor protein [Dioscorea alata]
MEEEGTKLGSKKKLLEGEVDYKTKAGTAWSHSYLNQKPWHPLSYPNQRRKWIAEQTHAHRERRAEEISREFAQEQEFFRQTALFSKKEKEKVEMMKAVSFMYVRPPGYNAESAKAAEIADEKKRLDHNTSSQDLAETASSSMPAPVSEKAKTGGDKKSRPKDVFGRTLPTEEEFQVLKNAPRMETGVPVRIKPFGVEIRNVRCVRCGTFGHQSGDRECPLKDAIMPNEESRLKRDDPLTTIMAQTDSSEPLKWELKQRPGMSPPRGGFGPDDPNQQIIADDIFDEYGGFLNGSGIPALLSNFSASKPRKHLKHKGRTRSKHQSSTILGAQSNKAQHDKHLSSLSSSSDSDTCKKRKLKGKHRKHKRQRSESSLSQSSDSDSYSRRHHHRVHHRHQHRH